MYRILAATLTLSLTAPTAGAAARPIDLTRERATASIALEALTVDAQTVELDHVRVLVLRTEWNRAVAENHPQLAGKLAVAHLQALQQERDDRTRFVLAAHDYKRARSSLVADEFVLQHPAGPR